MGSLGEDDDVRGERASRMARRVIFPVPFMIVAKTDASGGGLVSSVALGERDCRVREKSWNRWLLTDSLEWMVGAICAERACLWEDLPSASCLCFGG